MKYEKLLDTFRLISDQITPRELGVVLRECEKTLQAGRAGAVVEFGCYSGTTSLFLRRLLNEYGEMRPFHVYDSFEGLPPKSAHDHNAAGVDFTAGELSISKHRFLQNFAKAGLQPPITHKAWFDQLGAEDVPSPIAFAFLDGDFYDSILTSLRLVWPRLADGARVLVHDYHRETLPGVARAIDDFFAAQRIAPRVREEVNIAIISEGDMK